MKKSFNECCYNVLIKVPYGKVTTYKEIARALHSKAYRAVGNAMNKNPHAYPISSEAVRNRHSGSRGDSKRAGGFVLVPCHRVVNSNGFVGQ
ncbi:MAG: MGMT family protein, partial [Candidatus Pacearchaeota archaeon]